MEHPCKQDGEKRQSVIKQTFERKHLVNWRTQAESFIERMGRFSKLPYNRLALRLSGQVIFAN
jgi:hypothetical protein